MRSNVKKFILVFMLLSLVFSLTGCLKSNAEVAKSTVNKFFTAMENEDLATIRDLFSLQMTNRDAWIDYLDEWFKTVNYTSITSTITSVEVQNDIANVDAVTIELFTVDGDKYKGDAVYEFTLAKNSGKWYITRLTKSWVE